MFILEAIIVSVLGAPFLYKILKVILRHCSFSYDSNEIEIFVIFPVFLCLKENSSK